MTFYLLVIAMSQTTPEQEELGSRNDERDRKEEKDLNKCENLLNAYTCLHWMAGIKVR